MVKNTGRTIGQTIETDEITNEAVTKAKLSAEGQDAIDKKHTQNTDSFLNAPSEFAVLLDSLDETTVKSLTTANDGKHHGFMVLTSFKVVTDTTAVTLKITYTDNGGNAQTITILNAVNEVVGDYTVNSVFVVADPNTVVSVKYTAGTANQVYPSVSLVEVGADA